MSADQGTLFEGQAAELAQLHSAWGIATPAPIITEVPTPELEAERATTYRERRMARADRLEEWADKRADKAAELHARNEPFRGDIAFNTQPGHIPERARVIARTERAWEHSAKADEMAGKAAEIRRQAARAIYSDDPDALERLAAKLADLEAERDRWKAYNASCRRGARDVELLDAQQQRALADVARFSPYHIKSTGAVSGYLLTNLTGEIGRTRKRIAELERKAAQPAGTIDRRVVNRRAGECVVCSETVEPGDGFAERADGSWSVRHKGCER